MKMHKLIALPILTAAAFAFAAPQAHATPLGNSTVVNLQIEDYAAVEATSNITIKPTLSQIVAGTYDSTSETDANNVTGSPIELMVDSTHGAEITIDGNGGSLNDAHLSLKAGGGSWVSADDNLTPLYSSSAAQEGTEVPVAVKITNLGSYDVGDYSNTVTFTITAAEADLEP